MLPYTILERARSMQAKNHARNGADFYIITDTKADRGDLPTSTKVLNGVKVKDVIRRYIDEITSQKRSEDSEGYLLEAFLRQPIANLTLAQITPSHFSTYRDKRLKYVKAGTVRFSFEVGRDRGKKLLSPIFDFPGINPSFGRGGDPLVLNLNGGIMRDIKCNAIT